MNSLPPLPFLDHKQDLAFSFWSEAISPDAAPLLVSAFTVDEALFGLTRIDLELVSRDPAIDLQALLDTKATLSIHHKYLPEVRHFSGIVVEATRGDTGHHRTSYRLTLLPALARLDHGSDCRIFQALSVPEIVDQVLRQYGVDAFVMDLTGTHLPREYCVQYRETHLAFIERLLAEEGIWYYLTHGDKGDHTVVFKDTPAVIEPCPSLESLPYNALASGLTRQVYCSSLRYREKLRSTLYTQRDYTFTNPPYHQEHTEVAVAANGEKGAYQLYDYPGRYKQDEAGVPFTRHKLEATRVDASVAHGLANAPHLSAGHGVTLTDHPDGALNIKWRLLAVRHEGTQPQALLEDGGGDPLASEAVEAPALAGEALTGGAYGLTGSANITDGWLAALRRKVRNWTKPVSNDDATDTATDTDRAATYRAAFTAQPARLPYRPVQILKPRIDGPQIAHVVGPEGEEIYTDEYGRVKVWFPWDRHSPQNETASCWVRVSSNWAGAMWGHIAIPRIGHEVVVDFLEGDPDQPLIVGRTYHANNRPPYVLPEHKTKMVIRSDTHKGTGYNEMSFEDQAGRENMFFHAQKDQTIKVLNDRTKRVERNQVESVGRNKAIDVGENHQEKIGGSMNLTVGGGWGAAIGMVGGLATAAATNMATAAQTIGDDTILQTVNGIAGPVGLTGEAGALLANGEVAAAGDHFRTGGLSLASTAASVGGVLGGVFPMGGVMTTTVEKVKSTTVGLMTTEQTGLLKNTLVGHTELTSVGVDKKVIVGEELVFQVGKAKLIMRKSGEVIISGTTFNFTASGHVEINGKVIDLNQPGA